MGFKNGAFATLWNVDKENNKLINFYEKYADISVAISKKDKADDSYKTDFSSRVRCIGKAFETLKSVQLAEKDRIKLLEVEVTNSYDKDKKVLYTNYICWNLEPAGNVQKLAPQQPEVIGDMQPLDDMDSSGLPF